MIDIEEWQVQTYNLRSLFQICGECFGMALIAGVLMNWKTMVSIHATYYAGLNEGWRSSDQRGLFFGE